MKMVLVTKTCKDYKSEILVKKNSGINSLKDLKGKNRITRCNFTGYTFPIATIKRSGIDATKDMKIVNMKGHDQAVISLLNGDVDAAVFKMHVTLLKRSTKRI